MLLANIVKFEDQLPTFDEAGKLFLYKLWRVFVF